MADKKTNPELHTATSLLVKITNKTFGWIAYLSGMFVAFIVKWTVLLIGIFVWIAIKKTSHKN